MPQKSKKKAVKKTKYIQIEPLQFVVYQEEGKQILKTYKSKIKEEDQVNIISRVNYNHFGQYDWLDFNGEVIEVYFDLDKSEWQLCKHVGNVFDKDGIPVVKRKVILSFKAHKDEIELIQDSAKARKEK